MFIVAHGWRELKSVPAWKAVQWEHVAADACLYQDRQEVAIQVGA